MEAIASFLSMLTLDDAFFNVLYGAGYYANILRVVRRDMQRLLADISLPTGTPTGVDGARVIFETLTSLNSYTSWNFFVAILRMGDAWLASYSKYVRYGDMKVSGQTRQKHSRTPADGQSRLAWRHRSAPALVLLNQKYVNGAQVYGYDPTFHTKLHNRLGDGKSRSADSPYWDNLRNGGKNRGLYANSAWAEKRAPQDEVVAIENELDSEYCPFYFHDLRTNEVIGFHAFLSDVKDSYSVSYAESGGYGRIDKVKIYQDTTRSITFSFTMVATSPKDFDSMWWSFNKLISMIYPQFSMGKPVRAGDKKFVMPFSQIPTASPVIRVRIGDLIRSNYSRFNLARLFGLSEVKPAPVGGVSSTPGPDGEVNPAYAEITAAPFDLSATAALESATAEAAEADAEAAVALAEEMDFRFDSGGEPLHHGDVAVGYLPGDPNWGKAVLLPSPSGGYTTYDTGPGITVPAVAGSDVAAVKNVHVVNPPAAGATHVEATPFRSRPASSGVVDIYERVVVGPNEGDSIDQDDDELKEQIHAEYYVQYADRDDPADPYGPVSTKGHYHTYVVTSADLEPIMPEVATATPADATVTLGQQITDVTDFFSPDNNAIVRSFESAGGRGLAGVITSLDFDWGDAQWDMSGIGRRAPTMLNVNISFSPIHDIIPGLDNNGMMRAMNYPVGNIAGPMGTDPADPGAVQHPAFAMRSSVPGASYPGDASSENYSGYADSMDDGEEGGTP